LGGSDIAALSEQEDFDLTKPGLKVVAVFLRLTQSGRSNGAGRTSVKSSRRSERWSRTVVKLRITLSSILRACN